MFRFDRSSLLDSGIIDSRVPMNMYDPNLIRRERSMSGMEGEMVNQVQEQQQSTRAESRDFVGYGELSDLERFRRDALDLQQVQERQQQVEAAAAARALGLEGLESRPKCGETKTTGQLDAPAKSDVLPGLRWPVISNEGAQKQEVVHERSMFAPSLGLWGQESQDYASTELQLHGGSLSGTLMSEHVPIATTPSGAETSGSSATGTSSQASHLLGNWSLSNLHSTELPANVQSMESKSRAGSAAALIQPGWKAATAPKVKSLAEIQEEEAASRKAVEQATIESAGQSPSSAGTGLGPWAGPSVPQPKSLRDVQEEEAQKAAAVLEASQKAGNAQLNVATSAQKVPVGRVVDPPAWGAVSANTEKVSSSFEGGDENIVVQVSRKGSGVEASIVKEVSVSQSSQASTQSTVGLDDSDFIEPKESKKSKKRAAKSNRTTPVKPAGGATTSDVLQVPSPLTSSKSTVSRSAQVESAEESFPAPPPGPSLADFLNLGSEPAVSSQPLPAWSSTPAQQAKLGKILSLKEIQEAEKKAREEQERQNQMLQATLVQKNTPPPSAKPVTLMTRTVSGGAAWQRPGVTNSSALAVASGQPTKIPASSGSGSSWSKVGVFEDDDLFWDYGQDAKISMGAVKQIAKSEP